VKTLQKAYFHDAGANLGRSDHHASEHGLRRRCTEGLNDPRQNLQIPGDFIPPSFRERVTAAGQCTAGRLRPYIGWFMPDFVPQLI